MRKIRTYAAYQWFDTKALIITRWWWSLMKDGRNLWVYSLETTHLESRKRLSKWFLFVFFCSIEMNCGQNRIEHRTFKGTLEKTRKGEWRYRRIIYFYNFQSHVNALECVYCQHNSTSDSKISGKGSYNRFQLFVSNIA